MYPKINECWYVIIIKRYLFNISLESYEFLWSITVHISLLLGKECCDDLRQKTDEIRKGFFNQWQNIIRLRI